MNALEVLINRAKENIKRASEPIKEIIMEQEYLSEELRLIHKDLGINKSE